MHDILSAIRSLRRAPGHAIASLLTLGLGIGAVGRHGGDIHTRIRLTIKLVENLW